MFIHSFNRKYSCLYCDERCYIFLLLLHIPKYAHALLSNEIKEQNDENIRPALTIKLGYLKALK